MVQYFTRFAYILVVLMSLIMLSGCGSGTGGTTVIVDPDHDRIGHDDPDIHVDVDPGREAGPGPDPGGGKAGTGGKR